MNRNSIVMVDPNYTIERVRSGLNAPIHIQFVGQEIYYGDSGLTDGNGKLIRLTADGEEIVADGFTPPLTGITYHDGIFFVSHQGTITRVTPDGKKTDVVVGLPSYGDYSNNRVTIGPDGRLYFGQGTATNSGVVGKDNLEWLFDHTYFCDYPARDIILSGQNFETESFITGKEETVLTGAFSPYSRPAVQGERVRHILAGNGSVLRVDRDGSNLEMVAWGFRNPFALCFDKSGKLYVTNQGMQNRGSRPVVGAPDELIQVEQNRWYGWPDYAGGYPITSPYFQAPGNPKLEFVLEEHPMIPSHPLLNFLPYSGVCGFLINDDAGFGEVGEYYFAEFGPTKRMVGNAQMPTNVGHRITKFNPNTKTLTLFAANHTGKPASKSNGIGFERPIDVQLGPDHALYVVDIGEFDENTYRPFPKTGAIWRIRRRT